MGAAEFESQNPGACFCWSESAGSQRGWPRRVGPETKLRLEKGMAHSGKGFPFLLRFTQKSVMQLLRLLPSCS